MNDINMGKQSPVESTTVLDSINYDHDEESLADDDQSDEEDSIQEIPMSRTSTMVTRGSIGIFKPNPKYALSIAATEISVPKSAKYVQC